MPRRAKSVAIEVTRETQGRQPGIADVCESKTRKLKSKNPGADSGYGMPAGVRGCVCWGDPFGRVARTVS